MGVYRPVWRVLGVEGELFGGGNEGKGEGPVRDVPSIRISLFERRLIQGTRGSFLQRIAV